MPEVVTAGDFGRRWRAFYLIGVIFGQLFSYYIQMFIKNQKIKISENVFCDNFQNPWFVTLIMTIGMSYSSIIYLIKSHKSKDPDPKFSKIPLSQYLHAFLLAVTDIIYSFLYVSSNMQNSSLSLILVRIFIIFFVIIFETFYMKKKLYKYVIFSAVLIYIGLIISGIAIGFTLKKTDFKNNIWIVIAIQIIAQALWAFKSIKEEQLLKNNDITPVWLCAVEGIYEFLIILFIIYPIINFLPDKFSKNFIFKESLCNSFRIVFHSWTLIITFFFYTFLLCFYNISLLGTKFMYSAAKYLVLDTVVAQTIRWVLDLIIYYSTLGKLETGKTLGIEWNKWSFVRLIGVIILVIGAAFYTKIIRLKCFEYEDPDVSIIKMNNDYESSGVVKECLVNI